MKTYNGIYLIGNYPDKDRFKKAAIKSLEFFDFLEVGLPFSDPAADGPMIAEKSFELIQKGVKINDILETIKEIRSEVPENKIIYVMTYANHIYFRGLDNFVKLCKDNGINGAIIPDIPFVESDIYKKAFSAAGLSFINFITPESSLSQVEEIAKSAQGFIYAVSVRGTTGGELTVDEEINNKIKHCRKNSDVPVVLGFGIRDLKTIENALSSADGFIIGTKMIELLSEENNSAFENFINELKDKVN